MEQKPQSTNTQEAIEKQTGIETGPDHQGGVTPEKAVEIEKAYESPQDVQVKQDKLLEEIDQIAHKAAQEQGVPETQAKMSEEEILNYQHEDARTGIKKMFSPSPEKIMSRARKIFETGGNKGQIQKDTYVKLMNEGNTSKAFKFAEAIYDYTFPVWDEEKQEYRDAKGGGAMGAITG